MEEFLKKDSRPGDKTEAMPIIDAAYIKAGGKLFISPILFVCQENDIMEYRLSGHQTMGRPVSDVPFPDIPVFNSFVSKEHGYFDTASDIVCYTALETTNGTMFKGRYVGTGQRLVLKDGDELVIPTAGKDKVSYVTLVVAQTEERIEMWRSLQRASADKLTGLHQRDAFLNWWNHNYMNRDYEKAVLFIMDIDDFKLINDNYGHNAGDKVLQIVAGELTAIVRYERQICRWGGDEFVGILAGTSEHIDDRLRRLSNKIRERSAAEGLPVTVSIGYADVHISEDVHDISGIVKMADSALYDVKRSGKDRIAGVKG